MAKFKVGDKVILGMHDYQENWTHHMDKYVGSEATLLKEASDYSGVCWVVDTNSWMWREANMKLAKPASKYASTSECPCGIHPAQCDYHK